MAMSPMQNFTKTAGNKKPYKELTLAQKVTLIRLSESNPRLSQAAIAERYSIAKSNVCRILQRREEYLNAYHSQNFSSNRKRKLKSANASNNGNETLRVHMYKQHQISRMFMCRCCNFAFPDKTGLHLHMQAMGTQGKGKSCSTSLGARSNSNPSSASHSPASTSMAQALLTAASRMNVHNHNASMGQTNPFNNVFANGLFPGALMSKSAIPQQAGQPNDDFFNRLRERLLMNSAAMSPSGLNLASLLNSFPKVDPSGVASLGGSLNLMDEHNQEDEMHHSDECLEMEAHDVDEGEEHCLKIDETSHRSSDDSFVDVEEHNENDQVVSSPSDSSPTKDDEANQSHDQTNISDDTIKSVPATSTSDLMPTLRSAIECSPLNSLLYKKKWNAAVEPPRTMMDGEQFTATYSMCNPSSAQHEDCDRAHISPSDTTGSTSPNSNNNCYECPIYKGRLVLIDNRNKFLEAKTTTLESEAQTINGRVQTLSNNIAQLDKESRQLRAQNDNLQRKLLQCQEKTILLMQSNGANPALMQQFLTEILHATLIA